ncbi:MAG: hypothetical protein BGN96_05130 [Bacteroidales bacterium 45-6]|nr:MAG: hypothetical protein BGN96_05130 [Bacteroidales bacterium 45-6]
MGAYNHFEYGEMLATKLKAIRHSADRPRFYKSVETDARADIEQRLSEAKGTILIAHDSLMSDFEYKNADSLMESMPYEFDVLLQTESGDARTVMAASDSCKNILKQIISKMMLDYEASANGLEALDPGSFKIEPIGPVRDNFYGAALLFSLATGLDYRFNPEDWED